jgi:hypothetical protein
LQQEQQKVEEQEVQEVLTPADVILVASPAGTPEAAGAAGAAGAKPVETYSGGVLCSPDGVLRQAEGHAETLEQLQDDEMNMEVADDQMKVWQVSDQEEQQQQEEAGQQQHQQQVEQQQQQHEWAEEQQCRQGPLVEKELNTLVATQQPSCPAVVDASHGQQAPHQKTPIVVVAAAAPLDVVDEKPRQQAADPAASCLVSIPAAAACMAQPAAGSSSGPAATFSSALTLTQLELGRGSIGLCGTPALMAPPGRSTPSALAYVHAADSPAPGFVLKGCDAAV